MQIKDEMEIIKEGVEAVSQNIHKLTDEEIGNVTGGETLPKGKIITMVNDDPV